MSLDRPSDDPSSGAEPDEQLDPAGALRARGAPLLEALEHHSTGAREHADATATYAFATAAELGLEGDGCELVREAAMLHEIGQIYADKEAPPGSHHEETYRLARGAGLPEEVCGWLLRTRESFDGSGPEGLAAEQIPIESRLIRAACVFHHALGHRGAAGPEPPHRYGLEQISTAAGSELDPRVVLALSAVLERSAA